MSLSQIFCEFLLYFLDILKIIVDPDVFDCGKLQAISGLRPLIQSVDCGGAMEPGFLSH